MRALDAGLAAHLAAGVTTLCTCWRLTRADGAALGFTDHDRALTFGGQNFAPETGADGAALATSADLAPDNTEIEGALSSDALSESDLAAGLYDGARVEVWRVNWADPSQRVLLQDGRVGEIARRGGRFVAEVRGPAAALDAPQGRVYQRGCDARLGDARCGVDTGAAGLSGVGVVTGVYDDARFEASGLSSFADGWFEHGALSWTGGANAGAGGHVKAHGSAASGDAALSLWIPTGATIAVGDAFTVVAGCDKRDETCRAKFNNFGNFRGFPFMPGNDVAVSYPLRGEANDGGRRT
ncbi:MAG: DUF2163 domain-containing protein [Pseudomonadota bacterium]